MREGKESIINKKNLKKNRKKSDRKTNTDQM